jgi:hypothetical protein
MFQALATGSTEKEREHKPKGLMHTRPCLCRKKYLYPIENGKNDVLAKETPTLSSAQ